MADVTIKYKGQSIATMDASGSKTLGTQGKYCEGDIGVEYVKPAGPSGTKSISITDNGTTTEDVTNYASAEITVDVQGGGGLVLLREIVTTEDVNEIQTTIDSEILSYDFALVFMDFTLSASDWLYMGINNTQYYSISKVKWRLALPIIRHDVTKRFLIPAQSSTFAQPVVSDGDQFMCKCYVSTKTILSGSSLKFYGGNYADF
jgi:hypothetical protein